MATGAVIKGTLLDGIRSYGLSAAGIALRGAPRVTLGGRRAGVDGVEDSLADLLQRDDYCVPGSESHRMACQLLRVDFGRP